MKELLSTIKNEFPDKAIDISESLQLLKEMVNSTMEDINDKINRAFENRNFKNVQKYSTLAEQTYTYEKKIEEIIDFIDIENRTIENETNEEDEKRIIANYDDYVVDHNIEHSLYESFTHKRPYGFKMSNHELVQVKTWQDMYIKTCEILISIDENKFLNFQNIDKMNGKKGKYFSTNPELIRNPKPVLDKAFIETNLSGNDLRNLIIKLLKEYNIKITDYKVYFRADYTNLNK